MADSVVLYRLVGEQEYRLIANSGFRLFPPCLTGQPFFYPVTNEAYATQIARDWNTKDEASGWTGYALRFRISAALLDRYSVETVGSTLHQEYWTPAAELDQLNDHMEGQIEVLTRYPVEQHA